MKRIEFVKSLVGIYGLTNVSTLEIKQYEKVYLKQFFVRGFQYYEGPKCIDEINKSGLIELVREPENPVDKRAIALYFNKKKIGFVPRESNKTISILMDTDLLEFHAEITNIEPEAEHWEQIRVAIYALKEIKNNEDWKKIEPYAALKTPKYYSLKSEDDTLTRISTIGNYESESLPRIKADIYFEKKWSKSNEYDEASLVYYSLDSIDEFEKELNSVDTMQTIIPFISQQEEDLLMEKINFHYNQKKEYLKQERFFVFDINKLMDNNFIATGIKQVVGEYGLPYFEVVFEDKSNTISRLKKLGFASTTKMTNKE
jgi:predicted SnoaL-like aldol condensation-catalyzing enzyme